MKGVIFTEFLEMVEARYSAELVEELIATCDLPSGAAYTSIGTYDYGELVALVTVLSEQTGTPAPELVRAFGRYLLQRFTVGFPVFFADVSDTFGFLDRIEGYVHSEVRKMHPDAELPSFECRRVGDHAYEMLYRSTRGLADLAHGLIEASAEHFREPIMLTSEDLSEGARTCVRFMLRRSGGREVQP